MRGSESSLGWVLRDPVMWLDAEQLGWERWGDCEQAPKENFAEDLECIQAAV